MRPAAPSQAGGYRPGRSSMSGLPPRTSCPQSGTHTCRTAAHFCVPAVGGSTIPCSRRIFLRDGAWIHVRSCLAADRAPVGFWGASRWHPAPANLAGCAAPSEVGPAAAEEQGRHRGRAPWDGCAGAQPRTQSPTTTHIQPHSTRRNTTPYDTTLNIIYPNTN